MTQDEREQIQSVLKWWGSIAAVACQPPNGWPKENIIKRIMKDNFQESQVHEGLKEQIDWDGFQKVDLAILRLDPIHQQAIRYRYIYQFPFWWAKRDKSRYYNRVRRAEKLLHDII